MVFVYTEKVPSYYPFGSLMSCLFILNNLGYLTLCFCSVPGSFLDVLDKAVSVRSGLGLDYLSDEALFHAFNDYFVGL